MFPNANVYAFRSFSLAAASDRIVSIAQSYQYYRIKRITWQLRPAYDTFIATSTSATPVASSVPQLYWRHDRAANFDANTTLEILKASGCRPVRVDDKNIVRSFAPAVLQAIADAPGKPASGQLVLSGTRTSPWLPTNENAYAGTGQVWTASSVDHNGLLIAIDQDAGVNLATPCAFISFTVEFQFKKPLALAEGQGTLTEVKLEELAPEYVPPVEKSASQT